MASCEFEYGKTFLPTEASIGFEEITAETGLVPFLIGRDEFERVWDQLLRRRKQETG